jgi:glycosyltransferase involved in cell wall biosynthesis
MSTPSVSAVPLPLITVVTPSFNQAPYLEQALLSVLGQGWPRIEYIVMDGGSTDGSVEILQRYAARLSYWQSRPDGGQAAAINAAFAQSRGDLLCWVNSDDYLLPGALARAARALDPSRGQLLAGNCLTVDEASRRAALSNVRRRATEVDLALFDFLNQPATFWTRRTWELAGPLDTSLHFAFDWEWFVRCLKKAGAELVIVDDVLAYYRVHPGHKTGSGGGVRDDEIAAVYARHVSSAHAEAFARLAKQRVRQLGTRRWLKRLGLRSQEAALARRQFAPTLPVADVAALLAML